MAQIGIRVVVSGLSGSLLIRWVRASAPLAEVGRSVAMPFPVDTTYDIPDLVPVVYIVQLWRSDDGVSLDQLIASWPIDASKESRPTVEFYEYVTGRGVSEGTPGDGTYWADPAGGSTTLNDERIAGIATEYIKVEEGGFGPHPRADYDLIPTGGIELLGGKQFDDGTPWFITAASFSLVTIPAGDGPQDTYADVEVIDGDRDFMVDELENKLVIVDSVNPVVTVVFPDMSLIPDGTHVKLNTHAGTQNYLALQFDSGQFVRFNNANANLLHFARNEVLSLYFKGGAGYIDSPNNRVRVRGEIEWRFDGSPDTGDVLFADESTGVLNATDYPGLYAYVVQLTGDAVCPLGSGVGQWSYTTGGVFPNKCKYGIDTGTQTFRVPHLSGLSVKASSTPGVYQGDQVGPMSLEIREGSGGSSTGPIQNKGFSGQDNAAGWIPNTVGGVDLYIRPAAGVTETRVKTFSQKPFVIL